MAKKGRFMDTFLNLANEAENIKNMNKKNESNDDISEDVKLDIKEPIKENVELLENNIQVKESLTITHNNVNNNITIIDQNDSLTEYIRNKVIELEDKIEYEQSRKFKLNNRKLKFADKYAGITIALRHELRDILEELKLKSSLDKYEIIEMIFINGLKNTNFDE